MSEANIIVVDDEKNILSSIAMALESGGFSVKTAENGLDALESIRSNQFDVAVIDIMMPGIDGLEVLKNIREKHSDLIAIIMSGHGTISTAVQAVKLGAYDFLEKPISREKLLLTVRRAIDYRRLETENLALRSQIQQRYNMDGDSPAMKELFRRIEQVGPSPSRVLIQGENGVGKELVARALHQAGPRRDKPFIKVNCAAIPHDLIESELFGHEKGAFTGATARRRGKFELAHRGTIFLDEVGDMHVDTQAKVLRVLQENEFQRVGGDEVIKVDVRVIAATNKNLESEIKRNKFREDLYYRLNVIPIFVPALRERKSDISLITRHFFKFFAEEYGNQVKNLTDEATEILMEYSWPGNVRELRNLVERIHFMSTSDIINSEVINSFLPVKKKDESSEVEIEAADGDSLKDAVLSFERSFIIKKLKEYSFHISDAARALQIERSHLYKKIKALNIDIP